MSTMTWKQFKDGVDKSLKEMGLSEDVEIEYMDFSWPEPDDFKQDRLNVYHEERTGISIR